MANTIKLKRSSTASDVPTTGELVAGELALNTYDGKAFMEIDTGSPSVVALGDHVWAEGGEFSKGVTHASQSQGTKTSGSWKPDLADGNVQHVTFNGNTGITAPDDDGTLLLVVTNGASAASLSLTGFDSDSPRGDDYVTTNGDKFYFHIAKGNGENASLYIEAI